MNFHYIRLRLSLVAENQNVNSCSKTKAINSQLTNSQSHA